jgi:hypothetical protein
MRFSQRECSTRKVLQPTPTWPVRSGGTAGRHAPYRRSAHFGLHMTWTVFEFGKRRGQVRNGRQKLPSRGESRTSPQSGIVVRPSATCNLGKK